MRIEMVTKICCRLCLAPNEECVPIFTNFAADRQRLDHKIYACVGIKVLLEDNLSSKICHACISYLNSWQSFKNRCDTAERKQKYWSEIEGSSKGAEQNSVIQHVRELCPGVTIESISHNVEPHLKQNSATNDISKQNILGNMPTEQMDLSSIKKEVQDQPGNGNEQASDDNDDDDDVTNLQRQMVSACSVCDMTFSNRANARRHERNIHGLRQNPTNPMSAQVPQSVLEFCKSETEKKSSNNTLIMGTSMGMPSIDLKHKIHMKLKSHRDTYDYSNPARYRHLVTPSKLAFILRNLEFLEQAQDMKCRCCNKSYPSYKYFMGHMRKKYQNLPRNVCFKCLKQFSSKGQFIGHLKRKNCVNLYAVVMEDGSIPNIASKDSSLTGLPTTKEAITNKNYGCKMCNKEFNSKVHLRQHVFESHPTQQNSTVNPDTMCAYCLMSFEDAVSCQKHNKNLECIMFIVCCSCRARFDGHTAYVDHVYQHHLPPQQAGHDEYGYELYDHDGNSSSSHLRNPQNCPVCNKQYNNYYNVLRHMESKHPNQLPQIYQCIKCSEGFPRQSELRDHLQSVHGENPPKQQKQPSAANFPCKECDKSFLVFSDWVEHQNVKHSKFNCLKCDFKSESLESFTVHCFMEHRNYNSSTTKVQLYSCRQCTDSYNSIDSLQDHIESQHTSIPGDTKINMKNPSTVFDNGYIDEPNEPAATDNPITVKTLNCRLCGFLLTDIEALRQHMNKVHGLDKKFFYCNQCTAKFMNAKGLRVHFFRFHGVLDESALGNAGVSLLKPIQQATSSHCDTEVAATSDPEYNETDSFECSICHIVYKTADQLKIHMQKVHPSTVKIHSIEENVTQESAVSIPNHQTNLWFQCRYCTESFNNNKQLSIHMNTHEEHDKSDHSCKDCGGVYSTKKSLWVHRYKKHPKIPDASACDVCSRVFFDKTELFYHTSQVHSNGEYSNNITNESSQEDFHDMRYTTEALFSMLDTSVNLIDESFRRTNSKSEDPVYQCDICPKTFHILNALQVHRGWHFRSPDGRKVRDPNDTWQPDQLPPSKMRKLSHQNRVTPGVTTAAVINDPFVQKVSTTCPYCYYTFASGNNLKRHIVDVHKRNETKSSIQNSPSIAAQTDSPSTIERFRECTTCSLKFTTIPEWFDHRLSHARVQKPSQTFEWCCEICGKAFTRKERLLQHMISHINVKGYDGVVHRTFTEDPKHHVDGGTTVSLQSIKSTNQQSISPSQVKNEAQTKEENEEEGDDDDNIIEAEFLDDGDDNEEEDTNNSNDEDASKVAKREDGSNKTEHYFCELCQVSFDTADSLRQHVSEHFLIGALGGDIKFSRRTSTDTASSTSSSSSKTSSIHNTVDSARNK